MPHFVLEVAHELSLCLQRETGRQVFTPRLIALHLLSFYWTKRLYGALLERIQPEYALVADPGEYAITAAAKERDIDVLEYQHGFLDRDQHPAYAWTEHALKYKARMPIPDRLLLYGEYWKQELAVNGFWEDSLAAVGSLRMDHYRKARSVSNCSETCTIVLTTQGIDVENVIAFISGFLALADRRLQFRLYIKLHPFYETDKTPYEAAFLKHPEVQILLGSESPSTFELLARAQLHLTISSTCHYDALGLGVPTVILPFTSHEAALHLYETGQAFLAHSPQELFDIAVHWRDHAVPPGISEWYYKPGALENIKRELGLLS